jgi:hypothetical protein
MEVVGCGGLGFALRNRRSLAHGIDEFVGYVLALQGTILGLYGVCQAHMQIKCGIMPI